MIVYFTTLDEGVDWLDDDDVFVAATITDRHPPESLHQRTRRLVRLDDKRWVQITFSTDMKMRDFNAAADRLAERLSAERPTPSTQQPHGVSATQLREADAIAWITVEAPDMLRRVKALLNARPDFPEWTRPFRVSYLAKALGMSASSFKRARDNGEIRTAQVPGVGMKCKVDDVLGYAGSRIGELL